MNSIKRTILPRAYGCIPYLAYILVLLLIFGKSLLPWGNQYLFGWDILDFHYYNRFFFQQSLQRGVIPWWNPYQFSGLPFLGGVDGASLFYPFVWLFVVMPVNMGISWYYFFHIFIALTGMYLLLRHFFLPLPSWAGGIVFGLSGFFFPRVLTGTMTNIASASYLPIVFLLFWRSIENVSSNIVNRRVLYASVILALQLLAGDQRMAYYSLLVLGFTTLVYSMVKKSITPVGRLVVSVVLAIGLASVQLVPTLESILLSHRLSVSSYLFSASGSLTLDRLRELFYPITNTYINNINAYPPYIESPYYAGVTALILAITGSIVYCINLMFKRGEKQVKKKDGIVFLFFVLTIISLWLSMGPNASIDLFYILWSILPFFHIIRLPIRFLLVFAFGVSGLAAYGVSIIQNKYLKVTIITVLLAELVIFCRSFLLLSNVPPLAHDVQLTSRLVERDSLFRVHPNYLYTERLGYSMDFNAAQYYPYFSTSGYYPLIPANYYDFFSTAFTYAYDNDFYIRMNQMPIIRDIQDEAIDFLNVKYLMGKGDFRLANDEERNHYRLVLKDDYRFFTLYENVQALPRFFLASQAVFYQDRQEIVEAIRGKKVNIRSTVLLVDRKKDGIATEASCLNGRIGNVRVVSYGINSIQLETNTPCDAYLTSSEVFYPGWKAAIDGDSTELLEGNLAFRTLLVPAGHHIITMEYFPEIFFIGGAVSLIFISLCIVIFIMNRKYD